MAPGRPQMQGKQEAQAFWREGFSMADSSFTSHSRDLTLAGNLAIDRFQWEMKISPSDGDGSLRDTGKCLWIWRHEDDGEWRLAVAIWNSDQLEPTPWTGA